MSEHKLKPAITPAFVVPKKRGRPPKDVDHADWAGETPTHPKRYARTFTLPNLVRPRQDKELKRILKSIYNAGMDNQYRNIHRDVERVRGILSK